MKKNEIQLSAAQRKELEKFSKTGVHSAKLIRRAQIILLLDTSKSTKAVKFEEVAQQLNVSLTTITKVKAAFIASESVSAFLRRKKRDTPPVQPKITGEVEARIIALACGKVPEGCARWTVRLIAEKSVELKLVGSLSHTSVHTLLKKRSLSPT
jgi:Trp operon repressor